MLIIALAVTGGIAAAGLFAFMVLCLGIRREDKAARLHQPAPGCAAAAARRFTGLRAQSPDGNGRVSCQGRAPAADRQTGAGR